MQATNLINHIVFVVDRSTSMYGKEKQVISVFDNLVAGFAEDSKKFNQETRVSVYLFGSRIDCVIYDMDVLRLPSLASLYDLEGATRLIDATYQAIEELQQTPTKYGDHAFLMYVLTDGEENSSSKSADLLNRQIRVLTANWTFAAFVPNRMAVGPTSRFGFPIDNIAVWDTAGNIGLRGVQDNIRNVTKSYMQARSKGIRSTSSLFRVDTTNLTTTVVKSNLNKLRSSRYVIVPVKREGSEIRTFCEYNSAIGQYDKGHAFYQLSKPETVQGHKEICVVNKITKDVYSGTDARALLGLPDENIRVKPEQFGKFDVFVQSTSVNRKLVKGTSLLYLF